MSAAAFAIDEELDPGVDWSLPSPGLPPLGGWPEDGKEEVITADF